MLNCKQCNNEFKPRSSGNVYCSKECLDSSRWKPKSKVCTNILCGKEFKTNSTHRAQKYCSRSCSATVNNSTDPKRQRFSGEKNCLQCSKSLRGHNGKKFCSKTCEVMFKQDNLLETWLITGIGNPHGKPNHFIRKYITNQQNSLCAICAMPQLWNNQPLNFIMDHIDGNSENNKRSNLRLICPNCDSQLPTYKSKNKGNGRHTRRQRYANGKSY